MALINCPKCKNQVSSTADICPKCNAHLKYLLDQRRMLEDMVRGEKERQNAKCPECKQILSWECYRYMDSSIKFASYCKNCGYIGEDYTNARNFTASYKLQDSTSIFHNTAGSGSVDDVKLFIENGIYADINRALHIAAEKNSNCEVLEYLISKGANVKA
jgi:hypothetical protein